MKHLVLILLQTFCLLSYSQRVDYMSLRPSVMMYTSRAIDSIALNTSLQYLVELDTNRITKNLYIYYEDLGQCYWILSQGQKGSFYIIKSIEVTHKALYHKPDATTALWNLSFAYTFNGDCVAGKYYMEKYRHYSKKKYWYKDQERMLFQHCSL